MRTHAFGLHFLLGTSNRKNSARLAFSRPLKAKENLVLPGGDPTDLTQIERPFAYIESLDYGDIFSICFFKRFGTLIEKTLKTKNQHRFKSEIE